MKGMRTERRDQLFITSIRADISRGSLSRTRLAEASWQSYLEQRLPLAVAQMAQRMITPGARVLSLDGIDGRRDSADFGALLGQTLSPRSAKGLFRGAWRGAFDVALALEDGVMGAGLRQRIAIARQALRPGGALLLVASDDQYERLRLKARLRSASAIDRALSQSLGRSNRSSASGTSAAVLLGLLAEEQFRARAILAFQRDPWSDLAKVGRTAVTSLWNLERRLLIIAVRDEDHPQPARLSAA